MACVSLRVQGLKLILAINIWNDYNSIANLIPTKHTKKFHKTLGLGF